ncbi:MAG: efflux RND transporter periplasmic adaptor subunit [Acidobacteriota bacterium]
MSGDAAITEIEPEDRRAADPEEAPRRSSGPTWLVALGVLFALVVLAALTSPSDEVNPADAVAEPSPVNVVVARLDAGYDVERSFTGRVEAKRSSHLGFELGGRLTAVTVEEGDSVQRGQVLARLDTDRLEARRRSAAAQLEQATAEATLAELTRGRVREARALDAVSPQDLDEAELGLQASRAARLRAQAVLEEIEVELAKSRLTAPFDAIVAGRMADEGQVLAAGAPVLHVLERGRPEARIGVAGPSVVGLAVGEVRDVEVGGRELSGTVKAVLPVRRDGTRAVDVVLELPVELGVINAGDLARLRLGRRLESPGFWLPTSALTESSRGLWAAYAVPEGGAVERRELEVLYEQADRVFVRGTLEDGDRVVRGGLHRLVPGQPVRILEGDAPSPASAPTMAVEP